MIIHHWCIAGNRARWSTITLICMLVFAFAANAEPRPRPLDKSVPVVDARAHSPAHTKRFTMLDADYCVPWLSTLSIDPRGADARLNADTLATFDPAPWRKGQPNPDWKQVLFIEATVSRPGWGFPGVFELNTGKRPSDLADGDLATLKDIAAEISHERKNNSKEWPEGQAVVRTNQTITLIKWRNGQLTVLYAIAEGVVGSLTVAETYLEQLPLLIKAAQGFWRRC